MTSLRRALSVVVPAFNEESRLPPTLRRICAYLDEKRYDAEVLVVDDGSRDGTRDVVRALALQHPKIRLLEHVVNRGPGAAVRTGVLASVKDAVLYTDADLSTPIEDVERLWPAYDAGADLVMASRHLEQSKTDVLQPPHRRIFGRVFRMIVATLCVRGFRDTQCGFKLYRGRTMRPLFRRVRSRRFTFNVELLYYARQKELKVSEVPVRWNDVRGTKINVAREAVRTLVEILRIRGFLPPTPSKT